MHNYEDLKDKTFRQVILLFDEGKVSEEVFLKILQEQPVTKVSHYNDPDRVKERGERHKEFIRILSS